jgi:hypothetical protein
MSIHPLQSIAKQDVSRSSPHFQSLMQRISVCLQTHSHVKIMGFEPVSMQRLNLVHYKNWDDVYYLLASKSKLTCSNFKTPRLVIHFSSFSD